ncbi:MAG: hypothetical protein IJV71_07045 [Lachnospiraceae bacterium]|nr:hypothetical protein [Lachnospiraceae bacterium]
MEIKVTQEVVDTVCNSLRASKQSLRNQLRNETLLKNKKEIIEHQLADVEEALRVFEYFES